MRDYATLTSKGEYSIFKFESSGYGVAMKKLL